MSIYLCATCKNPFTHDQWWRRHYIDTVDGPEPVHDECCNSCPITQDQENRLASQSDAR